MSHLKTPLARVIPDSMQYFRFLFASFCLFMQLPWGAYVMGQLRTYLAMFYCCQLAAICGLNFSLASTQNIESR